jgi:hypothetical protein
VAKSAPLPERILSFGLPFLARAYFIYLFQMKFVNMFAGDFAKFAVFWER